MTEIPPAPVSENYRGGNWNALLRWWLIAQGLSLPPALVLSWIYHPLVFGIWFWLLGLWLVTGGFVTLLYEAKVYSVELLIMVLVYALGATVGAAIFLVPPAASGNSAGYESTALFIAFLLLNAAYIVTASSWGLRIAQRLKIETQRQRVGLLFLGLILPFAFIYFGKGALMIYLDGKYDGYLMSLVSIVIIVSAARIHLRARSG